MGKPREFYPSQKYFSCYTVRYRAPIYRVRSQNVWNNKKRYPLADVRKVLDSFTLCPLVSSFDQTPPPVEVLYGRPPFMSYQKRQACRQDFNHGDNTVTGLPVRF